MEFLLLSLAQMLRKQYLFAFIKKFFFKKNYSYTFYTPSTLHKNSMAHHPCTIFFFKDQYLISFQAEKFHYLVKKLTSWSSQKKYLVFPTYPKIKLDPPSQGKCFGVHILGPSLNQQIFPELEILSKNLMLLVLLGKFTWGIVFGALYGLYKCIWVGYDFYTKMSFFDNFVKKKKLDSSWNS